MLRPIRGGRADLVALFRRRGAAYEASIVDEFLGACMAADSPLARKLLERHPTLIGDLGKTDALLVHETAREGRAAALQLMAELGFDLRIKGNNGETALHWACWHGQAEAVRALVSNGADLDARESQFKAPPIGWLAHGSQHCRNPAGDYPLAAEILLKGGAEVPAGITASVEVMAVLKRFGPG